MTDPAWLSIALVVLSLAAAVVGLIGCIVPILPGPVLSLLSLFLFSFARGWEPFSGTFLAVMTALAAAVTAADYFLPLRSARKYGASRRGILGALLGMLLGVFFLPPFGLFLGAFLGALAGELLSRKGEREALRAAWGAFTGTVLGMVVKLAYSGAVIFFCVKALLA